MPVGANIRIAATPLDPTAAAAPAEPGSIEELFGQIIASLGEGTDTPVPAETASPAQQAPAAAPTEASLAAVAEQLLALADRQPVLPDQAETLPTEASETVSGDPQLPDQAEAVPTEAPETVSGEPQLPVQSPAGISAALERLLAFVTRHPRSPLDEAKLSPIEGESDADAEEASLPDASASEAPPVASPPMLAAGPAIISITNSSPDLPQSSASPVANAKASPPAPTPAPDVGTEPAAGPAAQLASTRTDAAVQQAFSSLQAVVKELPAQIWAAAIPSPSKSNGEPERSPLQDLELSALDLLPAIDAAIAPVEPLRRTDLAQATGDPTPKIDTAQLAVEHQLDMAHEGEWLDRLARDIAQAAGTDKNPLRFRLNPETLGTLRVEITQDRHGTAIRMTADTEAARSIIADAQPRLIAEARAQGIRISEAHVDLGGQTASGDPRRQSSVLDEAPLRTARSLQDQPQGDGKPTPGRSERYA